MDSASAGKYCYMTEPNPLQVSIAGVLSRNSTSIARLRDERYSRSQDIERELQEGLQSLGFIRSATVNTVAGLFIPASDFEIDFFNSHHGIGLEVEKGKHFSVWKNIVKFCESPLVRHGVLVIPYEKHGSRGLEKVFNNTLASMDNVHYLYERLDSLLCFGY